MSYSVGTSKWILSFGRGYKAGQPSIGMKVISISNFDVDAFPNSRSYTAIDISAEDVMFEAYLLQQNCKAAKQTRSIEFERQHLLKIQIYEHYRKQVDREAPKSNHRGTYMGWI